MLLALAILAVAAGGGRGEQLLLDPGPAIPGLYLTPNTTLPPVFHGQLYGPIGAAPTATARWHITQWNSPDPLPPVAGPAATTPCAGAAPLWYTSSRAGHVCVYAEGTTAPASVTVELHQEGAPSVCGAEFDTFLEPNSDAFPLYPQGQASFNTSLAALRNVTVSFGANLLNATVERNRCGASPQCGPSGKVDYGYGVLGVVAGNQAAGQTLFYQVQLGDTRDGECPGVRNTCMPAPLFWYARDNPYGASNTAAEYGLPCLGMSPGFGVRGRRIAYAFDVLPKIAGAILQGPPTMDKDLSAWTVGGIYVGLGLEGSVVQTLLLDSLSYTATPL
jgi:hypothetical protein